MEEVSKGKGQGFTIKRNYQGRLAAFYLDNERRVRVLFEADDLPQILYSGPGYVAGPNEQLPPKVETYKVSYKEDKLFRIDAKTINGAYTIQQSDDGKGIVWSNWEAL